MPEALPLEVFTIGGKTNNQHLTNGLVQLGRNIFLVDYKKRYVVMFRGHLSFETVINYIKMLLSALNELHHQQSNSREQSEKKSRNGKSCFDKMFPIILDAPDRHHSQKASEKYAQETIGKLF